MMLTASGALLLPYTRAAVTLHKAPPTLIYRAQTAINRLANQASRLTAEAQCAVRRAFDAYSLFSVQRPFLSAALTASTILTSADATCQMMEWANEGASKPWNFRRTAALAAFGFFYYGGPLKFLYRGYDRWFNCVFRKTAFDVGIHTPFCLIPAFYMSTGLIKGKSPSEAFTQLKNEWATSSFGSVMFWGPTCAINFTLVPPHLRLLTISTVSFFHKIWLSWMSNRQEKPQDPKTHSASAAYTPPCQQVNETTPKKPDNFKVTLKPLGSNEAFCRSALTAPDLSFSIPIDATVSATSSLSVFLRCFYQAIFDCLYRCKVFAMDPLIFGLEGGPTLQSPY